MQVSVLELVAQRPDVFIVKLSSFGSGEQSANPRDRAPLPEGQIILWTKQISRGFFTGLPYLLVRQ